MVVVIINFDVTCVFRFCFCQKRKDRNSRSTDRMAHSTESLWLDAGSNCSRPVVHCNYAIGWIALLLLPLCRAMWFSVSTIWETLWSLSQAYSWVLSFWHHHTDYVSIPLSFQEIILKKSTNKKFYLKCETDGNFVYFDLRFCWISAMFEIFFTILHWNRNVFFTAVHDLRLQVLTWIIAVVSHQLNCPCNLSQR